VFGGKSNRNVVGPHGLGTRNQRGQMLIDLCGRNFRTNALIIKPKTRVYTWKAEKIEIGITWTIYTCEAKIQKRSQGYADSACGR
jgi:hypothetical protein